MTKSTVIWEDEDAGQYPHEHVRIVRGEKGSRILEQAYGADAMGVVKWDSISPGVNNNLGRYFMEKFLKARDELNRVKDILNQITDKEE